MGLLGILVGLGLLVWLAFRGWSVLLLAPAAALVAALFGGEPLLAEVRRGRDIDEACKVMLHQFSVGFSVSVCNIVVHALVMATVVQASRFVANNTQHLMLLLIAGMVAPASILMTVHVPEVVVGLRDPRCRNQGC
jgi:H+/gluconate symporter-like permease